ncbi:MAG TPA: DUF4180 domain-containing protein [Bacteroidales bacterium]|nr:DUF4180 domain-containing protein [Bacteroidales bacterium]
MLKYHAVNSLTIAEVVDPEEISGPGEILDLMADARYNGSDRMIFHSKDLNPGFFELKTGIAGEILQKFSNYRMKLSIVGDFSEIKSKSLNDFIRESNRTGIITFVATMEEALERLGR